nr:DUF2207 domain-containing protein [Anaerolineae bacterium]
MEKRKQWNGLLQYIVPLVLIVVLLFTCEPVIAQEKTLQWHRWDVDIQINADGTFRVCEEFEIQFIGGPFTFGYRDIPVNQFEEIVDVSVHEGSTVFVESRSENPDTYYVTSDREEYVINWFYSSTSDQTRIFIVEYTVIGGIIINDEVGDRLFWKAIGSDHAYPIGSSTVVVRMPPGAVVDTTIGPALFGVDGNYEVASDGSYVRYEAKDIVAYREMEVGVRFPHGFVPDVKPSWQEAYEREQQWNDTLRPVFNLLIGAAGFLILIGGGLGIYLLWVFRGRDPKVGIVPEYLAEPPTDLRPGLVGTLVDEKADLQDIIATLVHLASCGALDMQEEEESSVFGLAKAKKFTFRKNSSYEGDLTKYESTLLRKVFGSSDSVELTDLQNKFYTAISTLQKQLYEEAVAQGLFRKSPKAVRSQWLGMGILGIILSIGVGMCTSAALASRVDTVLCPFIAMGLVSLVIAVASRVMPAKTTKGAEESEKWKAFRTYLKNAGRYSNLEENKEVFERYLPYAIAFGLERSWINQFKRIEGTPIPHWYYPASVPYHGATRRMRRGGDSSSGSGRDLRSEAVGSGLSLDGMSDSVFGGLSGISEGLFSMLNSTASVFQSAPSSSGSGGFSGGGFSGGGFSSGGGGGGGGAGFG